MNAIFSSIEANNQMIVDVIDVPCGFFEVRKFRNDKIKELASLIIKSCYDLDKLINPKRWIIRVEVKYQKIDFNKFEASCLALQTVYDRVKTTEFARWRDKKSTTEAKINDVLRQQSKLLERCKKINQSIDSLCHHDVFRVFPRIQQAHRNGGPFRGEASEGTEKAEAIFSWLEDEKIFLECIKQLNLSYLPFSNLPSLLFSYFPDLEDLQCDEGAVLPENIATICPKVRITRTVIAPPPSAGITLVEVTPLRLSDLVVSASTDSTWSSLNSKVRLLKTKVEVLKSHSSRSLKQEIQGIASEFEGMIVSLSLEQKLSLCLAKETTQFCKEVASIEELVKQLEVSGSFSKFFGGTSDTKSNLDSAIIQLNQMTALIKKWKSLSFPWARNNTIVFERIVSEVVAPFFPCFEEDAESGIALDQKNSALMLWWLEKTKDRLASQESFNLSGTGIIDFPPFLFSYTPNLKTLNLSSNPCTERIFYSKLTIDVPSFHPPALPEEERYSRLLDDLEEDTGSEPVVPKERQHDLKYIMNPIWEQILHLTPEENNKVLECLAWIRKRASSSSSFSDLIGCLFRTIHHIADSRRVDFLNSDIDDIMQSLGIRKQKNGSSAKLK